MVRRERLAAAGVLLLGLAASVSAQSLGTFRWQLQPYCNVLTLSVIAQGGIYTLDGTDDLCGAPQKASVTGAAFPNPDGSIGFGLTEVAPSGVPLHIRVTLNVTTLNGTWTDSNTNSGTLVFNGGLPGSPRPAGHGAPTRLSYTYDLAAGAVSPPIKIPDNLPVSITGSQLVVGFRGVGHASLLSIPGAGGFIEWVGLHSTSAAAITQGYSGTAGAAIVYLDWSHCVAVEVAGTAGSGQIQIHNACSGSRSGNLVVTY